MGQPSWIGKRLGGRYMVEELLGQGGMSSVYKGTDPNLRRTVAIKMIHPHLSQDPQFVSRFEEEAAAVARIRHPNIIQVYDFDHDDDTYFMVLEYVPGQTLQDKLAELNDAGERLPVAKARDIAASMCDALQYAHDRGMIHRDIKPANIMITDQGQAILMDFGVAKMVGGKQHTATGAVVGTALYISPEQVRGMQPDPRVDIYALGVTLFEMLSGQPPFEADSAMSTMMMHVNEPVPDLRQLNADVPPDLVAVVEKALAKDRDQRYQTAADMGKALRKASVSQSTSELGKTTVEPVLVAAATIAPGSGTETPSAASTPGGAPPPQMQAPGATGAGGSGIGGRRGLMAGGAAIIVLLFLCLVVGGGGYYWYSNLGPGAGLPEATATEAPVLTNTPQPTATPSPPTNTPVPTVEPTATEPIGPYVRINGITLDGSRYVVDYETFGYIENLPGQHVHFFFNSVPPEQAGVPGNGPWYVYGGPRPFRGYGLSDKPAGATQMCTLSANPNHTVVPGSGNCVVLPEG
ncbi:MAG: protein kinase [Anaerolineales bacterium]